MNGNSLRYLFLLIIFSFNTLFSQNVIKGTILDSHNIPIPFANVLIKHNGKIIASKFSDQVGKFEINTGQFEKITISITSIGYYPFSEEIIFEDKSKVLEKNFILESKDAEIKEVVIKYVKPLTVKKDTIVFDAKSFLQGNEQVVEDLLKKYQD